VSGADASLDRNDFRGWVGATFDNRRVEDGAATSVTSPSVSIKATGTPSRDVPLIRLIAKTGTEARRTAKVFLVSGLPAFFMFCG
jgi:hypothetical protein